MAGRLSLACNLDPGLRATGRLEVSLYPQRYDILNQCTVKIVAVRMLSTWLVGTGNLHVYFVDAKTYAH